jgi:hypothetical protein
MGQESVAGCNTSHSKSYVIQNIQIFFHVKISQI